MERAWRRTLYCPTGSTEVFRVWPFADVWDALLALKRQAKVSEEVSPKALTRRWTGRVSHRYHTSQALDTAVVLGG